MASSSFPRQSTVTLFAILFLSFSSSSSALVFMKNQAECKVKCLNGGVCAYERNDPEVHKCMCFIDMYYGDLCQFKYVPTSSTTTTEVPTTEANQEINEEEEAKNENDGYYDANKEGYKGHDDLVQSEDDIHPYQHGEGQHPHSDELYHEAHVGSKASRAVVEHEKSRVYTEQPGKDAVFNKLDSYEQNNDAQSDYYEEEEDWMLVKRSAYSLRISLLPLALFSVWMTFI
ncbi:unnamed protein product [Bursaphelenchus xylophilus]|uniref:(pine wood nematode) hypothetical protein n=1 Tax=Bursaphelenchus xylophilus TaxID=6326 RepID=A0A1I7RLV5_BURXY|nr:unnamed protein product [Bursaphelenchus xylophilus]CAG9106196.1 unnamed protein product [Bursaphelenchus xylophilus]